MGTEKFFATPQGAAIMKHSVLKSYIHLFVNKLGSTHSTVHYLDGYAGPGVYGDGSHGSPKLAVDVAALVEEIRDLRCTFVEKKPQHAQALKELLATELPQAKVIEGDLRDHVADIAEDCDGSPLLAFIDPFGLGLTYTQLKRLASRTNRKTDIIMNVSVSAIRRVGGQLFGASENPTYLKARKTMLDRFDDTMGGDWWREVLTECRRAGDESAAHQIAHEYARRCQDIRGGYFLAEVKDRWDGPVAYYLLLLAGHNDAFWNFNEFMSAGHDALRSAQAMGQGNLLVYQDTYAPILEANIRSLLGQQQSAVLENEMVGIYGSLLGIARGTHLRPVIKSLVRDGFLVTSSRNIKKKEVHDGQGDLQHMTLTRADVVTPEDAGTTSAGPR